MSEIETAATAPVSPRVVLDWSGELEPEHVERWEEIIRAAAEYVSGYGYVRMSNVRPGVWCVKEASWSLERPYQEGYACRRNEPRRLAITRALLRARLPVVLR